MTMVATMDVTAAIQFLPDVTGTVRRGVTGAVAIAATSIAGIGKLISFSTALAKRL
jgi:hypothetical protein